jgi:hypothetical protein
MRNLPDRIENVFNSKHHSYPLIALKYSKLNRGTEPYNRADAGTLKNPAPSGGGIGQAVSGLLFRKVIGQTASDQCGFYTDTEDTEKSSKLNVDS